MGDTDNEGIDSFLDEIIENIKRGKTDKLLNRMDWLLSMAIVTGNRDVLVVEGILRSNIGTFRGIIKILAPLIKKGTVKKEEGGDLLKRARDALLDMIAISKDYLHSGDKTKFFDTLARGYYIIQEVSETVRLVEEG